jgi:predicted XRE-type DNA-binding protein
MKPSYYQHHIVCEFCGKHAIKGSKKKTPPKFCSNRCVGNSHILSEDELLERAVKAFEKDVIKQEGCWGWKGTIHKSGYPTISTSNIQKTRLAHRISWIIHKGSIPNDLHVLHSCDVRSCTNPEHLFLGTHLDNMRDRTIKLRQPSKLTKDQVIEIKQHLKEGHLTHKEIAKTFGVAGSVISNINKGKSWSYLFTGTEFEKPVKSKIKYKLTDDQVFEIKKLLKEKNLSHGEIAKIFGVSRECITGINIGRSYCN